MPLSSEGQPGKLFVHLPEAILPAGSAHRLEESLSACLGVPVRIEAVKEGKFLSYVHRSVKIFDPADYGRLADAARRQAVTEA